MYVSHLARKASLINADLYLVHLVSEGAPERREACDECQAPDASRIKRLSSRPPTVSASPTMPPPPPRPRPHPTP